MAIVRSSGGGEKVTIDGKPVTEKLELVKSFKRFSRQRSGNHFSASGRGFIINDYCFGVLLHSGNYPSFDSLHFFKIDKENGSIITPLVMADWDAHDYPRYSGFKNNTFFTSRSQFIRESIYTGDFIESRDAYSTVYSNNNAVSQSESIDFLLLDKNNLQDIYFYTDVGNFYKTKRKTDKSTLIFSMDGRGCYFYGMGLYEGDLYYMLCQYNQRQTPCVYKLNIKEKTTTMLFDITKLFEIEPFTYIYDGFFDINEKGEFSFAGKLYRENEKKNNFIYIKYNLKTKSKEKLETNKYTYDELVALGYDNISYIFNQNGYRIYSGTATDSDYTARVHIVEDAYTIAR